MNITQAAQPYVDKKLRDAQHAFLHQDDEAGFKACTCDWTALYLSPYPSAL